LKLQLELKFQTKKLSWDKIMAGRPIQRIGDSNTGGGIIVGGGQNSVLINGRPAAKPGQSVTPHLGCGKRAPQHCRAKTTPTSSTVFANGSPLVLTGGKDSCGHGRTGGSPNVFAQ
jgi:uncharacterized Zn-binding protein involved in type VI secretion